MAETHTSEEVKPHGEYTPWSLAREIPIDLLVTCEWNVNEMGAAEFKELVSEIDEGEFDEPCQVVPIDSGEDAGKFLIIGGEHRYKAAKHLGFVSVPCVQKDHLDPEDEEALMEWSVKRNNIRGKINAQKFAELEMRVSKKRKIAVEAARKRMFVRGEALKKLRKTTAIRENEDDETEKGGRKTRTKSPSPKKTLSTPKKSSSSKTPPSSKKSSKAGSKKLTPTSETEKDFLSRTSVRQKMLANLRALEQEVLLEKGDTIEQGYIYFGQGGSSHLVVQEEKALYSLVDRMVGATKRESAKINEFLISAITNELKNWE